MFNSFQSNRIEALAAHLSQLIAIDPLSPFDQEVVLVESAAMSQWLMQQLAKNNGIAANMSFPFPAALLWKIYRLQQQDLPSMSAFDRVPLTYRLYDYLQRESTHQHLSQAVSIYIDQLMNNCQLFTFCEYLAGLYDQYQIYRPALLMEWKASRVEDNFQAAIWFDLHQTQGDKDRAEIFFETVDVPLKHVDKLGFKRLHIFALSNLPAPYMAILAKLGESLEVNLFVLNPCALFWSDIKHKKIVRDEGQEGHPLLAMMAHQAQDFHKLLEEYPIKQTVETFIEQPPTCLLDHVQSDILHLRQREKNAEKALLTFDDNSLVVHAAHSPMREVQIVKNQILAFLDANQEAEFDQIVVMVSDLERYSPYFHSVFLSEVNPLPFHLAERRALADSCVKMALLELLNLKAVEYTRSSIIDCLKLPIISGTFGIVDVPLIEQLLSDLSVHFGLTDDTWQALGSEVVSMALEQGVSRLMESYCFSAEGRNDLIAGVDEQVADQAGRLCEFIDRLAVLQAFDQARSAAEWVEHIESLITAFITVDDDSEQSQLREIRTALDKWQTQVALSGCESLLDVETFHHIFEGLLENMPVQHYFRKDVINIATLLPMRSLPFEMVCLLGMNDGEFPKPSSKDPLDFLQLEPKVGDRNRQTEERYLFLEALLAARKKVHISYIGRSVIDNSERFPSLLVAELLDYIQADFCFDEDVSVQKQLVIEHPLQAFDQRYFVDDRLKAESIRSYDEGLLKQASALQSDPQGTPYAASLLFEETQEYSLRRFIAALTVPQKTYLSANGIYAQDSSADDEDVELMAVSPLESYSLLQALLLEGQSQQPFSSAAYFCQHGFIPQGQVGVGIYDDTLSLAASLLAPLDEYNLQESQGRYLVELTQGEQQLSAVIEGLTPSLNKRLSFIGKKIHGVHILHAWIQHVLLQAERGEALHSYVIGEETLYIFKPVEQEEASALVSLWFDRVYQASAQLVHFFVRSGFSYFIEKQKGKGKEEQKFRASLEGGWNSTGERDRAEHRFAYRGNDVPFFPALQEAENMFTPMAAYLEIKKR